MGRGRWRAGATVLVACVVLAGAYASAAASGRAGAASPSRTGVAAAAAAPSRPARGLSPDFGALVPDLAALVPDAGALVPPGFGVGAADGSAAAAPAPAVAAPSAPTQPSAAPAAATTAPATPSQGQRTAGPAPGTGVASDGASGGAPAAGDPGSGAAPARAAGARRTFTVAVTGDVLPHQPVVAAARTGGGYDFVPQLRALRGPIGDADLALCHMEVPLARDHAALSSYPVFNAPAEVAGALAEIGYDGCSTASNHSFDRGVDGVDATLDALDDAGLGHAGTARSKRAARDIRTYDVGGVTVAHLSYTYGLNGFVLPDGKDWLVNTIRVGRILRDARRARDTGADVVLVSLHWGTEYMQRPTADQRRVADRLLDGDEIDALIGHHAHVVQPVERVHGKVVIFGLGNLISNQSSACCAAATQDGVVVELTLRDPDGDGRFGVDGVTYRPTMVQFPQRRVVLVDDLLARTDDPGLRSQLQASRRRTRRIIGDVAERVGG